MQIYWNQSNLKRTITFSLIYAFYILKGVDGRPGEDGERGAQGERVSQGSRVLKIIVRF